MPSKQLSDLVQLPALPGTTRVFRPPWDGRERRQELVRGVAGWRAFASAGSRGHSPGPLGPQARERESSVRLRSPRKQESRKLYLLQLRILGEALFIFLVPVACFQVSCHQEMRRVSFRATPSHQSVQQAHRPPPLIESCFSGIQNTYMTVALAHLRFALSSASGGELSAASAHC